MKKIIIAALIISVLCLAMLSSCSDSGSAVTIDMIHGKESSCFNTLRDDPKTLKLDIIQKGETKSFTFEGVYLKDLLEKENIKSYSKIEIVASDMDENIDITELAKSEAGVFLAWSESGIAETPMRVMPADAATGNLLTRNVTSIIITK